MAKKKTNPVVYVAPNSNINQVVEKKLNAIPPYEDSSVKYQGYSKKSLGSDEYRLNPQNKIIVHDTVVGLTEEDIYTVPEGKKLCIASAIISHSWNDNVMTDPAFYITDGESGTIPPTRIQLYYRPRTDQIHNLIFEPCLEFRNAVRVGQTGDEPRTYPNTDITLYGWLEDL